MRLFRISTFLLLLGVGPLTGCPKTEEVVTTLPTAEAPGDPKANFAEGVRALKTPDKSGAINYTTAYQWFEFAAKADPGYAKAHYNLGTLLLRRERLSEASEQFQAALQLDPDFAAAHYNQGCTLAAQAIQRPR